MNIAIHRISLDIHNTSSQTSVSVKRGDTARGLHITLTENGKPYKIADGCSAVFRMKKPADKDGNRAIVYNDCVIEGNIIIYNLTSSNTEVVGAADCEITLYGAEKEVITSPHFSMVIADTVNTDGEVETIGHNEFAALVNATAEAKAVTEEVEQKLANGDFVGEKGEKGDQGLQGEKGEKGDKGEDADPQLFANAVIGYGEGEAVRTDDVSPVEHYPLVKVKSKNLFNTADDYKGYDHSYADGTLTVTGQYTNKFILLEDGKKYTFSCQSTRTGESGGGIFLRAYTEDKEKYINVGSAINVLSPTLTTTLPIGYPYLRITFYGYYTTNDVDTGDATYTDIMLEEGANATGYIPYVDPASATVTTCGKNLWNKGDISINGAYQTLVLNQTLLSGITYTLTADVTSTDTDATTCMIYTPDLSMSLGQIQRGFQKSISFTPTGNIYRITFYSSNTSGNGANDTSTFSNIQLEVGNAVTDFEEYKDVETYTPNADGIVEGITSLSPTMTLLTDTEGVFIHCEYNRDTNKVLSSLPSSGGAMVTNDGTVVSQNADFGEVAEWGDGNPNNEDRTGYFVCADVPVHGIVMKKATSTDDVKGVTILAPAFAGNYSKDKVDSNGNLLPQYSYVAIIGFVPVIDNGTCEVGGRCMPDDNGCAVPSSNSMGYQVVNRIDENRVLIIIEPNGDMVQRVKTKIVEIQEDIGDIETALDSIIAIQEELIGGDA